MRFGSLYLLNYIAIYNGMNLTEINIDFNLAKHRIITIRGMNGSGKSTIMNALTIFPDSNDSFIPGVPAEKRVTLVDGPTIYDIQFIHGVKHDGTRETTKAYIKKVTNGIPVELNPNGNVSSYKDIVYEELNLDPNFVALSQLSSEDRGLADKRPAERKRFVTSIIESLEVYNDIYKTLSKKASNYKSMINTTVSRIGSLGDINVLQNNLVAIDAALEKHQYSKESALGTLAEYQHTLSLLDPNGEIESSNLSLLDEYRKHKSIQNIYKTKISKYLDLCPEDFKLESASSYLESTKSKINQLLSDNKVLQSKNESLLSEKTSYSSTLLTKNARLKSLSDDIGYENICDELANLDAENNEIAQILSRSGINFEQLTRDEFILALETLKDIKRSIGVFRDQFEYEAIVAVLEAYKSGNSNKIDIQDKEVTLQNISNRISSIERRIIELEADIKVCNRLNLRPAKCNIDTCDFIKDAVLISKNNPGKELEEVTQELYQLTISKEDILKQIAIDTKYNIALNQFSIIMREIDKNKGILFKMPNANLFINKVEFIDRMLAGFSFDYIDALYSYIDMANQLDLYRNNKQMIQSLEGQVAVYQSKISMLEELQQEISQLNNTISSIDGQMINNNMLMQVNNNSITSLTNACSNIETLIDLVNQDNETTRRMNEIMVLLEANKDKVLKISKSHEAATAARETIEVLSSKIRQLNMDRDKINHSIQQIEDYNRDLEVLNESYNMIEAIKYYSSPTTGIQLVFMELYMGNVITLANQLLSLLFAGEYVIQPFIINESEFRIPCLGTGYLNDDISSMSNAQKSMIAMIISFSLLHNSSTKFNIIKLDEIDGALDSNNRLLFIDVLNRIMDIMGTEQCVMVSHNAELQTEQCDVILLRNDNTDDYNNENIIWRYQ